MYPISCLYHFIHILCLNLIINKKEQKKEKDRRISENLLRKEIYIIKNNTVGRPTRLFSNEEDIYFKLQRWNSPNTDPLVLIYSYLFNECVFDVLKNK